MDKFSLTLRTIVFFLFPVPFLLNFAVGHGRDWTGYVAYAGAAALTLAAATIAWMVYRRASGR
jgi:hypothetical protein